MKVILNGKRDGIDVRTDFITDNVPGINECIQISGEPGYYRVTYVVYLVEDFEVRSVVIEGKFESKRVNL